MFVCMCMRACVHVCFYSYFLFVYEYMCRNVCMRECTSVCIVQFYNCTVHGGQVTEPAYEDLFFTATYIRM